MNSEKIEKIREDLILFSDFEVVVFGSLIEGGFRPRSDIDIAFITRTKSRKENLEFLEQCYTKNRAPYDLHIYELMPLIAQASLWNNYEVVFGDPPEISEYFYEQRKIWDDNKHRIFENQYESVQEMKEARKKPHIRQIH